MWQNASLIQVDITVAKNLQGVGTMLDQQFVLFFWVGGGGAYINVQVFTSVQIMHFLDPPFKKCKHKKYFEVKDFKQNVKN